MKTHEYNIKIFSAQDTRENLKKELERRSQAINYPW